MRSAFFSASLAVVATVTALPQEIPSSKILAPALPVDKFKHTEFPEPIPLEEAKEIFNNYTATPPGVATTLYSYKTNHELVKLAQIAAHVMSKVTETVNINPPKLQARATCSSVRTRMEWDSFPDSGKQQFVDAIKCLMGRAPSGQFSNARSRYEDFVALHQRLTPNVHQNSKFLLWHRYFLWTFESVLRDECGYQLSVPWFDETRYAGRFAQSSIFSDKWLGGLALGGDCVRNGVS